MIIYINIFVIGVAIGLIIGSILWLKQISDDMTKFNIETIKFQREIAKFQRELDALEKEQTDGNKREND